MFESAVCHILFYIFAVLATLSALGVFMFRNPVASALSMALCFAFTAAILFGMGAQFLGVAQLIVYAGAILVLFLFIVMMLDVKTEEKTEFSWKRLILGPLVAGAFAGVVTLIALNLPGAAASSCCLLEKTSTSAAAVGAADAYGGSLPKLDAGKANLLANPGLKEDQATSVRSYPDTKLLGMCLFNRYGLHFAILSFALLAGSVGAVALARKIRKD